MRIELLVMKKEKSITPVTIALAKTSLKKIKKKMRTKYKNWLSVRQMRKNYLKILEVISKGDEKDYMFREQQEAQTAQEE